MWSLGFLEARDEPRVFKVSSRGYSLLVIRRLVKRRLCRRAVSQMLARYIVLKAVADVDWDCFASFLVARFQEGMKPSEIHARLFREDSRSNFSHRFGLHDSIALQTHASNLFKKKKLNLADMDPYSETFRASAFFGVTVFQPPRSYIDTALQKSLGLFRGGILGRTPLSSTEALKSAVAAMLLSRRCFLPEPVLSSTLLELLIRQRVSIYQNPGYLRQDGRGLYRNGQFYTIFSLSQSE